MVAPRSLSTRLAHLEDQALARVIDAEAVRIGELVGAPPAVLLARAVEIAEQLERHGRDRAIERVAQGVGTTAEDLETRVARIAPGA